MPLIRAKSIERSIARSTGLGGLGFAYNPPSEKALERFDLSKWYSSPLPPEKEALQSNVAKPTIYPEFDYGLTDEISQVINYDALNMRAIGPPIGSLERWVQANPLPTLGMVVGVMYLFMKEG